jgi:NAD(P)-dependent dehydrogenase (short-subunit alcohol dehydrogenase family)
MACLCTPTPPSRTTSMRSSPEPSLPSARHYAFNCAVTAGEMAPTADCTEANWHRTMLTNVKGVWLCLRAEIAQMLIKRGRSGTSPRPARCVAPLLPDTVVAGESPRGRPPPA